MILPQQLPCSRGSLLRSCDVIFLLPLFFLQSLESFYQQLLYHLCHLEVQKYLPATLYTSRKPPRHLLATGVPSCEEPGSAHEQTCKISREELPHPIKQRRDELRKNNFFVSLPLRCRLLISVDSCAEWGWPDTLGTIQGAALSEGQASQPHFTLL